jgi:hypothetical protein
MATATHAISWQRDLSSALAHAQGKLVLLDITAAPM